MAKILKRQFIFILALLAALFFSILLFPLLLLMILLFVTFTSWRIYRSQRQQEPLPKGTIEILPKEESEEPVSTKNEDLEITIDTIQRKVKNERNDEPFRNSSKHS